jgi:predicted nucleic acid-binding protein
MNIEQGFLFVDCTSFVIAKQRRVKEAFGFGDHFKTMGFILIP